jgi:hypothetical protein
MNLLNLAQDAVLGWLAPLKSPVGTTEKVIETDPDSDSGFGNFQSRNISSCPGNFQSSVRDSSCNR